MSLLWRVTVTVDGVLVAENCGEPEALNPSLPEKWHLNTITASSP